MEDVACAREPGLNETSFDYEPCGAAVVGGLYTLNCGSSEGGAVVDAAVGDADVDGLLLESLPVISGAVNARVGTGLLGLDIGLRCYLYRMRVRVQNAIDAAPRFLRPDPFLLHHGPSALSARYSFVCSLFV